MKYQLPKFSVAMPSADVKWPFKGSPEHEREFCPQCDLSVSFCECPKTKEAE